MFENVKSLMESGKLTEELAEDLRRTRRDLDELSLNLRRDLSAMQGDITELKNQLSKLTQEHATHVAALGDAHREFSKLHDAFGKELAEFRLAKNRVEERFLTAMQQDLKRYIAELKQNLSGFQEVSREATMMEKTLKANRAEIDKFNALAAKVGAKDLDLVKFTREVERISREKLGLLRKIDFLERLVARERRRK